MSLFLVRMTSYKDAIKASKQGILLSLQVIPGSSQTVFPVCYNQWRNSIEMKVKGQAKDNEANCEVLGTLARFFRLASSDVVLVSGEKNRQKTVCLKNISLNVVESKFKEFFNG